MMLFSLLVNIVPPNILLAYLLSDCLLVALQNVFFWTIYLIQHGTSNYLCDNLNFTKCIQGVQQVGLLLVCSVMLAQKIENIALNRYLLI